jgi:hypothetical protein
MNYEDIKQELIEEINSLGGSLTLGQSSNAAEVGRALNRYTNKMVEVAVMKLDQETQHYAEIGKAAEAFFGSMKLGG